MIRLTTIPPPMNDFSKKCIDWGSCGICAVAAKNSVLLYYTDMTNYNISLLCVVEFSMCNIFALKFHNDKPILAISRDSGLLIYDCQEGKTKSGLTGEIPALYQIEWCGDILIGFSKPNLLFAIQIFPPNNSSPVPNNENDRLSNATNITPNPSLPRCQIIWKFEMKGDFKGISIDPFSRFRILAYSNDNSFSIYHSDNSLTAPHFILSSSLSSSILDAQFHPQISDIIFILTNDSAVISFEIQTQSTFFLIQEPNSLIRFEQLIFQYQNFHDFFIICSDSSIISYETIDNRIFQKRYWGSQVVKSLRSFQQSFDENKRIHEKCFLLSNFLFDDTFLLYSKKAGLSLMKSSSHLFEAANRNDFSEFIVSFNNITPHKITAFDTYRNNVGYGTAEGDIYIIDSILAKVKFHFHFGDQVVKFLFINSWSFIWISLPKKSSHLPNFPSSGENDHFHSQLMNAGYFNIVARKLVRFKNVSNIYSNRKYGIIQHGGFYFEIIHQNETTNVIRKLYMPKEISAVAIQIEQEIQARSSSFHHLKERQNDTSINRHRSVTAIHKNRFNFIQKIPPKFLEPSSTLADSSLYEDLQRYINEEEEIDGPQFTKAHSFKESESSLLSPLPDNYIHQHLSSEQSSELMNSVESYECDDSDSESESGTINHGPVCKEGGLLALVTAENQNIVIYDIHSGKYTRKLQCPREFSKTRIVSMAFTHNLIVLIDNESHICLVNLKQSSSQRISSIHFNGIQQISFQKSGTKFFVLSNDKKLVVFDNFQQQNNTPIHNSLTCNHYVNSFSTCHNQMLCVQSTRQELKFVTDKNIDPIKQAVSIEKRTLPTKATRLSIIAKLVEHETKAGKIGRIFSSHFCSFESLIWQIADCYFNSLDENQEKNRALLPLKFYQYGGSKEYQHLMEFKCSLIQSNSEASMYQFLTAKRCQNLEKMRESILHSTENAYAVMAASVIDAKLSDKGVSFIEAIAMQYFDQDRNLEATILMELIDKQILASKVLQSKNRWGASIEILLGIKHKKEAKQLIETAAFHYLDIGEIPRSLLLFVSIGEFYPALLLLMECKMYVVSYFLLKYTENRLELKLFPDIYNHLFAHCPTIDELKQSIQVQFEDFMKI